MLFVFLVIPSLVIWVSLLLLPWKPYRTSESLDAKKFTQPVVLDDITVLIPARNEVSLIARTLEGLRIQGEGLKIIVIDDQSSDGTASIALQCGVANLEVISGLPLPDGWSGKLWALEQGWRRVATSYVLLLDADIELRPGVLATLFEKIRGEQIQFISLMVSFQFSSFWEKVLLPAFIYYFKLLYPFSLSNQPKNLKIAAAAGGCILMESRVLKQIGGFSAIRQALIDDCTLAKRVKVAGNKTWIGLTHSAHSRRPSHQLNALFKMIARSAFTQLGYSTFLLFALSLLLTLMYCAPITAILSGNLVATVLGAMALLAMMLSYLPTLKYYNLSKLWAFAAPLSALMFFAATWYSATCYWRGQVSSWKGRVYAKASVSK